MACGEPSSGEKRITVKERRFLGILFVILLIALLVSAFYKTNSYDKKQAQCRICQYGDKERYKVEYWNKSQHRWMIWAASPFPDNITLRKGAESVLESCIEHYRKSKNPAPTWHVIKELHE